MLLADDHYAPAIIPTTRVPALATERTMPLRCESLEPPMSQMGQNPKIFLGALCLHPPGADMMRRVVRCSSSATLLSSLHPTRNETTNQKRVMFAGGGFGYLRRLALYSSTTLSVGPITHSYIVPMLRSSRGSASMLKTLG